jgi:hypothetical protein
VTAIDAPVEARVIDRNRNRGTARIVWSARNRGVRAIAAGPVNAGTYVRSIHTQE